MLPKTLSKPLMRYSRKLGIDRRRWLDATKLGSQNNKQKRKRRLGIKTKLSRKLEQKPMKPNRTS